MFLKIGEHYYNRNHIASVSVFKEDKYTVIAVSTTTHPDELAAFYTTLSVPEVQARLDQALSATTIVNGNYFEALFEATERLKRKAHEPIGIAGEAVEIIESEFIDTKNTDSDDSDSQE